MALHVSGGRLAGEAEGMSVEGERETSSPETVAPPRVPSPAALTSALASARLAARDASAVRSAPLPSVVPSVLRGSVPGQRRTESAPTARIVDRDSPTPVAGGEAAVPAPRAAAVAEESPVLAVPARTARSLDDALARARTALALGPVSALVQAAVEVTVEVDADGRVVGATQGSTWRAVRPGPARVAVPEVVADDSVGRPVVEALEGCTLGRTYVDLREGVFVTALELPGAVPPDATWVTRHRTRVVGAPDVRREVARRLDSAVGTVRLEVHFDPARLPSSGAAFLRSDQGEVEVALPLVEGRLLWSGTATAACVVGLRWQW